jgi:hypothetical protein
MSDTYWLNFRVALFKGFAKGPSSYKVKAAVASASLKMLLNNVEFENDV